MTPSSPEPSMEWRKVNSNKKSMKPLVKVSVPPRMPKRKNSTGFFAFIKSILTLSFLKSKKTKNTRKKKTRKYNNSQPRSHKTNRKNKNQNNRSVRSNNRNKPTHAKKI
jgi:hypothetical protein